MKRIFVMAAAVLVAATALGAAEGARTAAFTLEDAWCNVSGISAGAPGMQPKAVGGLVGGGQRVAFRANLARYDSATRRWVRVASAPWKYQLASYGFHEDQWYEVGTDREVGGGIMFNIRRSGYYAVYFNLYWYANEATGASSEGPFWAPNHHDMRIGTGRAVSYCRY